MESERIEDKLKTYIVSHYGDLKSFAIIVGIPNSTMSAIFQRGLKNSTYKNVLAICDELGISMDALAHGEIEYRQDYARQNLSVTEGKIISYMKQLNPDGQEELSKQADLLVTSGKYRIDIPTAGNGGTHAV